ncbi:hypothetical protein N7463_007531 [Penicillium fimorum]|uniref:Uncharacterized protein n=1 Tax=Penicillium fimorum TaxID=1882269 RepID=A0A9W9XWM9_9EURO|nr:hypothetical protein N7463_007531 [Penicillium fimorum]
MPNPGKKRAAEWCTFCEMTGHTREECRRWAACLRDTVTATHAAIMEAHKPSQPKTNPNKKARRHHRGGQNRQGMLIYPRAIETYTDNVYLDRKPVHYNAAPVFLPLVLPPRPPPPTSSADASGRVSSFSTQPMKSPATTEGNPGVNQINLFSRLGRVSQSEAEFLLRALNEFRERSAREDFVEKPVIENQPDQKELTQGPDVGSGSDGVVNG